MTTERCVSPIPPPVVVELRRVEQRWHQLPLDHALSRAPVVRKLVQSLADQVAAHRSQPVTPVPDLGPGTSMHQLQVMVYDLFEAEPACDPATVLAQLTGIRRSLS